MPESAGEGAAYGNLASYKHCTRPAAHLLYGGYAGPRTRHQKGMHDILRALFKHGACTTWEVARIILRTKDISLIRAKEKECRRLFAGRYDSKKRLGGMLDTGLVAVEEDGARSRYRLTIHGMLYCIDVMSPSGGEMDQAAAAHAGVIPLVLGRREALREALGDGAYTPLRVLAKGILLDGQGAGGAPLHEAMLFLGAKYHRRYESIAEAELAEQLSYWYYTFLLFRAPGGAQDDGSRSGGLLGVMRSDAVLLKWYEEFLAEAASYYKDGLSAMSTGLASLRGASPGVALDRLPQGPQGDGLA